jgi:hypothetical protein
MSHSDVCELPRWLVDSWVRSTGTLFKQHIAPTPHNAALVLAAARRQPGSRPVLLLLRDVRASLHARCERMVRENQTSVAAHVANTLADEVWAWHHGWRMVVQELRPDERKLI